MLTQHVPEWRAELLRSVKPAQQVKIIIFNLIFKNNFLQAPQAQIQQGNSNNIFISHTCNYCYFLSLGWAQLQQDITAKNEHIRTVEAENAKLHQQLIDKELVKLK